MANKKISQLTTTTTADDNSWIVMNDSGNTATYRIKRVDLLAGTDAVGLVAGTGTDSIKSTLTSTPATASGTNSIAIGKGASSTNTGSITYGNNTTNDKANAIAIGNDIFSVGERSVSIGKGLYGDATKGTIQIGDDLAASQGSIVIGNTAENGNPSRATGTRGITIGASNTNNKGNNAVVIGSASIIDNGAGGGSTQSVILGGKSHTISSTGTNNMILGGASHNLSGATNYTTFLNLQTQPTSLASNTTYVDKLVGVGNSTQLNTGGGTNTQTAGSKNNFVVGSGNTIGGSSSFHVVFGEGNSNTNGNHPLGSFIFGRNCNANSANNRWSMIVGNGCAVNATTGYVFGDNSNVNGDYGLSIGTNIVNAGSFSFAYGDGNRVITPYNLSLGMDNDIESGSYNAEIGGTKHRNPSGSYNGYLSGRANTGSTSNYGAFISGESNIITGAGTYNSIINGSGNTISSKTRATMVGTDNRTANYDNTTYTENLFAYQAHGVEWKQGGNVSGSFSVDLSTGSLFSFTITGNIGTIQLNNTKIGYEYEFWVYNSGTYTISSINLDGVSNSCFAKGSSVNPTNNGYTYYRLRIVDDGLGGKVGVLDEHLNFGAL